jgi:hypothetical protein
MHIMYRETLPLKLRLKNMKCNVATFIRIRCEVKENGSGTQNGSSVYSLL